ncbi:MAG TPA: YopX family protein [Cyclobacteriaceae bacterium]|jgi:uncharacterized phage protein (TIGR01671 family)
MLNNELKFKVWNKVKKKMYISGSLSFSSERHSFVVFADKEMGLFKDDDIEILQFTGQKDMNNREVYQRDIVEIEGKRFIVIWDNNRGGWSYTDVERKMISHTFGRSEANNSKVIGNEFETPELATL